MNITQLSDTTYRELFMPDDVSIPTIAYYYETNLGQLSNLLGATFTIDSSDILTPELTDAQAVIYKFLYLIYYYNRQIQKNLGAGAYSSSILEVTEGDRSIRKVDKTNIAKQLLALVNSLKEQLNDNLYAYNSNNALPYSIDVTNPVITESLFWGGYCNNNRFWKMRV